MADMCSNCNAYLKRDAQHGWCRAGPPVPIVVGIAQPTVKGARPEPIIQALFPPMDAVSWCRSHQPATVPVMTIDTEKLRVALEAGSA